jgi:hypothetical protein
VRGVLRAVLGMGRELERRQHTELWSVSQKSKGERESYLQISGEILQRSGILHRRDFT